MGADSLDGQENGEGTGPRFLSVGRTQAPGPQVSGPCLHLPPIAPRSRLLGPSVGTDEQKALAPRGFGFCLVLLLPPRCGSYTERTWASELGRPQVGSGSGLNDSVTLSLNRQSLGFYVWNVGVKIPVS